MNSLLVILSILISLPAHARSPRSEFVKNANTLAFDFVLHDTAEQLPAAAYFYLQGSAGSNSQMIRACGSRGSKCYCEYYGADDSLYSGSAEPTYFNNGNYFRCIVPNSIDPKKVAKIKLRNVDRSAQSDLMPVSTELSLSQWLGSRYARSRVRIVYSYDCTYFYLQKQGTSVNTFDCSNQRARCGEAEGNFCFLKSQVSYYLFHDDISGNFAEKASDKLYNNGQPVCGRQLFQYSCTSSDNNPRRQFGLYYAADGIWKIPVSLVSAPNNLPVQVYGYAAEPMPEGECPLGLVKKSFFRASSDLSRLYPTHNVPAGFSSVIVSNAQNKQTFLWSKLSGGECDGQTCNPPSHEDNWPVSQVPFVSEMEPFCVLPDQIL